MKKWLNETMTNGEVLVLVIVFMFISSWLRALGATPLNWSKERKACVIMCKQNCKLDAIKKKYKIDKTKQETKEAK